MKVTNADLEQSSLFIKTTHYTAEIPSRPEGGSIPCLYIYQEGYVILLTSIKVNQKLLELNNNC